jgi:hypothetical protein
MTRINLRCAAACSLLGTILMSGCRSSTSTMMTRDEMNASWCQFKKVDGFPITIKVPTHLKMYVYETHYLEQDDLGNGIKKTMYVDLPVTIRDFAHEMVYSEKIVMVDFKRPAAGAFNLEVDLTDDQYIKKIQHDVTDQTLNEINGILNTLGGQNSIFRLASKTGAEASGLTEVKSVVAVGMFEVDAPDFELQVTEFLNCHINKSHDAWRESPGVRDVNRVFPQNTADLQLCPNGECSIPAAGAMSPLWPPHESTFQPELISDGQAPDSDRPGDQTNDRASEPEISLPARHGR